jgi:hypothetical protein
MRLGSLFPVRGAPQVRIQNLLEALANWDRAAVGGLTADGAGSCI